jgi:hypothetical protein
LAAAMNLKHVSNFGKGLRLIKKHNKINFLDRNDNLTLSRWVDNAYPFVEDFAVVEKFENEKKMMNYVDLNGKLLSKIWFSYVPRQFMFIYIERAGLSSPINDFCFVELNGQLNLLHKSGILIYKDWKINW